ncbi:MAG: hypothetical protein HY720_13245 [Planctomycetes bacterium]|nr:hypothetical protein [Planctomycetota bacterium]
MNRVWWLVLLLASFLPVAAEARELVELQCQEQAGLPEPTETERKRGFMLFSPSPLSVVFRNAESTLGERVAGLRGAACPGEFEPVVLVLRNIREESLERVSVELAGDARRAGGGTIPRTRIRVRTLSYRDKYWFSNKMWVVRDAPLILEEDRPSVDVPSDANQPFWITIEVPEPCAAGLYRGTVVVKVGGEVRTAVPLEFTVRPFRLARGSALFAMIDRLRDDERAIRTTFDDMAAHGMNSVLLCGESWLDFDLAPVVARDGSQALRSIQVEIRWKGEGEAGSIFERNMDVYSEYYFSRRFTKPVYWIASAELRARNRPPETFADKLSAMGIDIEAVASEQDPVLLGKVADAYVEFLRLVHEHGKEAVGSRRRWAPIVFEPLDEAFSSSEKRDYLRPLIRLIYGKVKALDPEIQLACSGLEGNATAGTAWNPANLTEIRRFELLDYIAFHDGPAIPRGNPDRTRWQLFRDWKNSFQPPEKKRVFFYNIDSKAGWHPEPLRFMYGLGQWYAGADGCFEWAYGFNDDPQAVYATVPAPPDYEVEQPSPYRYPRGQVNYEAGTVDELGGPAVGFETIREGIDDYRYLATFLRLRDRAVRRGDARRAELARALWDEFRVRYLDRIGFDLCKNRGNHSLPENWTGGMVRIGPEVYSVQGDLDVPNGLSLQEYAQMREFLARGIEAIR